VFCQQISKTHYQYYLVTIKPLFLVSASTA